MALLDSQNTKAKRGDKISLLMNKYETYKRNYAANIKFDSGVENLSKCKVRIVPFDKTLLSDVTMKYTPMMLIHIYFDTETFDMIERDVKMTLPGILGLIGGTMGLFTGFSILSAVEICYFTARFFMSRRIWRRPLKDV